MTQRIPLFLLILFFGITTVFGQAVVVPPDSTETEYEDVDDFLFDTEGLDDEETDMGGYLPGVMKSSDDVFSNNAAVSFNIAYFKNRGLESRYQTIAINGLEMENMVVGRASNTQWGGLTRIFNGAKCNMNLSVSPFAFGDIGGSSDYNIRASSFHKQLSANYTFGNASYNHRFMLTYASGALKNGWAVAASASARFGTHINYVKGTSFLGFSYFLGAEKKFNNRHSLSFAAFGAPTQQGLQANCVPEVYELTGTHYYNPNWGWFEGKRRNARVRDTYEPVFILTHNFNSLDKKVQVTTSLGSSFGHKNTSAFNFVKTDDPRPDYYRYLPSYFDDDMEEQAWVAQQWAENEEYRQINWDKLYEANRQSAALGGPSQYIIENRISQHVQVSGATSLTAKLTDHINLYAGMDVRGYRQRNFKQVKDLLGGEYWLSKDKYVDTLSGDPLLQYYDIDNAEAHLTEGDKCGYDYALNVFRQNLWVTVKGEYNHLRFHIGVNGTMTELWRTGFMRYGAYRDVAADNSDMFLSPNYGAKAGIAYKIDSHNTLEINGQWQTAAPVPANVFVNALYSNRFINDLRSEKDLAADFSYIMNYKFMKMRASFYFVNFQDVTEHYNFYHDLYGGFVNYVLTGVNKRNIGVELGVEIPIGKMFTVLMAGNWGEFLYTNRPTASITANNGYAELTPGNKEVTHTIYWKNYHVAGTPQLAATVGLKFKHKDWEVKVNANYFDKIYAALNSERYTPEARGYLEDGSELLNALIAQEQLKGQFTLDASISKSWKIKKHTLGFSLKVTNITNNKNLVTSVNEQHRFNYMDHDASDFPNKYYYALGTTFNFGLSYSFN